MLMHLKQLKYRLRLTSTDSHLCLFSFNYHVLTPMMEIYCFQILLFLLICLGYSVSDFWQPSLLESGVSSTPEAWWKIQQLPSTAYMSQLVVDVTFLASKFDKGHHVVLIFTNNIQYSSSDTTRLYTYKNDYNWATSFGLTEPSFRPPPPQY